MRSLVPALATVRAKRRGGWFGPMSRSRESLSRRSDPVALESAATVALG
jgi:hypothetical protein